MNVQNFRRRFMVGSVPEKVLSLETTSINSSPAGDAFEIKIYLDGLELTEEDKPYVSTTISGNAIYYHNIHTSNVYISCNSNTSTSSTKTGICTVKYKSQSIVINVTVDADYVLSTESVMTEYTDTYYLTSVDLIPREYSNSSATNLINMRLTNQFWLHYIISQVKSGATKNNMASNTTIYTDGYFDSFINSIVLQYWNNPATHSPCNAYLGISDSSTNNQLKAKWGDKNKSITGSEIDMWWGDARSYGYSYTLFDVEPKIYLTVPKSPPTVNIIGIDGTISQYYVGSSVIKFFGDKHSQSDRFKIYTGVGSSGYPTYSNITGDYMEVTLPIYGTGGSTSTEGSWYWPGEGFTTQ